MTRDEIFNVFLDKLCREPVYLFYEYEDAVLRSVPNRGWYVKFKGAQEFKAVSGSKLVTDAILVPSEITKEEYDRF